MAFLDPKPSKGVQKLIDQVNRGEMIDEMDLIRLSMAYVASQQVRDLVNPTGVKILKGDINTLPI